MFDLRAISPFAPLSDIEAGLLVILAAAVLANLFIMPKLLTAPDRRAGLTMLSLLLCAITAALVVLALAPPYVYRVAGIYILLFLISGLLFCSRVLGWRPALYRVTGGAALIALALILAYWAAYMPR